MKIAIVGAGLSGATLYDLLRRDGHDITLFEKSRGVGGRCSTRYIDERRLDHGTPYFRADDTTFVNFCEQKVSENIVRREGENYYPTAGMNRLCASLIDEGNLYKNSKIVSCHLHEKLWTLQDAEGRLYGDFDRLIITIPAPQLLELDITIDPVMESKLKSVSYDSIATLLLSSQKLIPTDIAPALMALSSQRAFKKIVDNSAKYSYEEFASYIIHLDSSLTNSYNFTDREALKAVILDKAEQLSGIKLDEFFEISPHFWKYALVSDALPDSYLYDADSSLGLCGDYFMGEHLQSAYLSATRLYDEQF